MGAFSNGEVKVEVEGTEIPPACSARSRNKADLFNHLRRPRQRMSESVLARKLDHTYYAVVLELANGTLMYNDSDDSPEYMDILAENRIKDALLVVDYLDDLGPYHFDKRAMFGDASGGCVMLMDPRVLAGATLDGAIRNPNKTMVIDHSFLLVRSEEGGAGKPKHALS
ncbi:MAG: hypothetical protein Q9187_007338 [Circinaria calcarea]